MPYPMEKKMQKMRELLNHHRQKMIVRVWGLAKRLDPRQMRQDSKKKKGEFRKFGNK